MIRTLLLTAVLGVAFADSPAAGSWPERTGLQALERQWRQLTPAEASTALIRDAAPDTAHLGRLAPDESTLRCDLRGSWLGEAGQATGFFRDEMPFAPSDLADPGQRWLATADFQASLGEHWRLWERVAIDSEPLRSPASRTKEFHQIDASIEVPDAAVVYARGRQTVWIGRRWERWGPGWTGSLVLEPHGPTGDGFGASWNGRRWSVRYRCERLDDFTDGERRLSRTLAGHRLDFAPGRKWRLGLSETALVSSATSLPLWMLDPVLPWSMSQSEQRGSGEGTNILWAGDVVWNPTPRWSLYGQFLLDDYMIDEEDRDTHPDQLAWLGGVAWASGRRSGTGPAWRAGFEYTRIGSWVYVHRDPALRYRSWSGSAGHPAGPDSEAATAFCRRTARQGALSLLLWGRWMQRGQVWLDTPAGPVGSAGQPFPTRPLSRWWQAGAAVAHRSATGWEAALRGGWTDPRVGESAADAPSPPDVANPARGFWASLEVTLPRFGFKSGR